jgi:hypothetical protein
MYVVVRRLGEAVLDGQEHLPWTKFCVQLVFIASETEKIHADHLYDSGLEHARLGQGHLEHGKNGFAHEHVGEMQAG